MVVVAPVVPFFPSTVTVKPGVAAGKFKVTVVVAELTVPWEFFAAYEKVQVAAVVVAGVVPAGKVALKPPLESTLTVGVEPLRPVQVAVGAKGVVAVAPLTVSG
jgi:hypothetical protein